jgi:opacity protein-like surface antigen
MKRLALGIAALMVVGVAQPGRAQQSIHLGVGGGGAIPVGKLDSTLTAGPGGLVYLAIGPQDAPLGLRLDYQYAGFNGKTVARLGAPKAHISSVTANLVVPFRVGGVKPYIISGAGWYPIRLPGDTKRANDWGYNAGAGIGFPLPATNIGAFLEIRYHDVNRSNASPYHFIPLTFGILF